VRRPPRARNDSAGSDFFGRAQMHLANDGSQSDGSSAVALPCECPLRGPKTDETGLIWLWHMRTKSDGREIFYRGSLDEEGSSLRISGGSGEVSDEA